MMPPPVNWGLEPTLCVGLPLVNLQAFRALFLLAYAFSVHNVMTFNIVYAGTEST